MTTKQSEDALREIASIDGNGKQLSLNFDPPTMESVVKEVMEAGGLQVWAMGLAVAKLKGLLTEEEMLAKVQLLNQAAKIWAAAKKASGSNS